MPRVITSLCLRDASCTVVCPVDCIKPRLPIEEYPTYYINPDECIDCGACEAECPNSAIFEKEAVPADFTAKGGERVSMPAGSAGYDESWEGKDHAGEAVKLAATRVLKAGESMDLTPAIEANARFFTEGPGKG
jgi:NAD-dependent dihydropyrimidine dehydrogenase PreA subunit